MPRLTLLALACLIPISLQSLPAQTPPAVSGYQLSWFDNFEWLLTRHKQMECDFQHQPYQ